MKKITKSGAFALLATLSAPALAQLSDADREAWMQAHAGNAERMVMTTRRFFLGMPGPATAWNIFIVPPAK